MACVCVLSLWVIILTLEVLILLFSEVLVSGVCACNPPSVVFVL